MECRIQSAPITLTKKNIATVDAFDTPAKTSSPSMLASNGMRSRGSPDLVVSPQADPLGDLPVLASLLSQDLLDLEGLVGRLQTRGTCELEKNWKVCLEYAPSYYPCQ